MTILFTNYYQLLSETYDDYDNDVCVDEMDLLEDFNTQASCMHWSTIKQWKYFWKAKMEKGCGLGAQVNGDDKGL